MTHTPPSPSDRDTQSGFLKSLASGLVTGAAYDEPSGIAT